MSAKKCRRIRVFSKHGWVKFDERMTRREASLCSRILAEAAECKHDFGWDWSGTASLYDTPAGEKLLSERDDR
jgi:hypothetical protein